MNSPEPLSTRQRPFLWAIGEGVPAMAIGQRIRDRYRVIAPQIWQDTRPDLPPDIPDTLPATALPYLQAHPLRLHAPGLYGILGRTVASPILLLENSPIHPQSGELYPGIVEAFEQAPSVRQLSWLWQLWELWAPLQELGVASSLLSLENIRVEGWRVRLQSLTTAPESISPAALALAWSPLVAAADPAIARSLSEIVNLLEIPEDPENFAQELNQLLLHQAAHLRVRLSIAGASEAGPNLPRNEDACFPDGKLLPPETYPQLAIVCDGVGGHAEGDVASHLAVQSLQLQLQGLLAEANETSEPIAPQVIGQQLEAVIRIVNDVINHQNDSKSRADRQRMGPTLVMAVVVPQSVQTEAGWTQVNELYIAHVGDSRAYWITPDYCHLLTVDDNILGREVSTGRLTRLQALQQRPDAEALTQAIGTRSAERLRPHIQRFVLQESGVLLLCTDGLSDGDRIEHAWANYIGLIIKDIVSLEAAVASWIELANQKNGHDNTSVVLMHCRITPKLAADSSLVPQADPLESRLTPSAEALLYGEPLPESAPPATPALPVRRGPPLWAWGIAIVILIFSLLSWWAVSRQGPAPEDSIEQAP